MPMFIALFPILSEINITLHPYFPSFLLTVVYCIRTYFHNIFFISFLWLFPQFLSETSSFIIFLSTFRWENWICLSSNL
jgi:hypothetical protein